MKTEHTPTPWKVGSKYPCRIMIADGSKSSNLIASTADFRDEGTENAEEKANAAFIVEACNAHDKLKEINTRWKRAIEGLTPSGSEFVDDPENCAAYIRSTYSPKETFLKLRAENDKLRAINSDVLEALKFADDVLDNIFEAIHKGQITLTGNAQVLGVRQGRDAARAAIAKAEGIKP